MLHKYYNYAWNDKKNEIKKYYSKYNKENLLNFLLFEEEYENFKNEIFNKAEIFTLLDYEDILIEKYPNELLNAYEKITKDTIKLANVKNYVNACKIINTMWKVPNGDERAYNLIKELKNKYPRRTRMIAELNKIETIYDKYAKKEEFKKIDEAASELLNHILNNIESDMDFYEEDIDYEYSSFEETVKEYCDNYVNLYLEYDENEKIFNNIAYPIETIEANELGEEEIFRPVELLTYYIAKIIIASDDDLKNKIHFWINEFIEENDGFSIIVKDYFKPFLEGKMIYHSDNYYTDYDDFKETVLIYKHLKK